MVVLGFNAVVESTEVGVKGRDWRSVEWGGLFHCYLPLQLWASYRNPAPAQLAGGAAQQCAGRALLKCSAGRSLMQRCDGHTGKAPLEKGEACSALCKAKPLREEQVMMAVSAVQNSWGIPYVYDHVQVFNMTLTLEWTVSRGSS